VLRIDYGELVQTMAKSKVDLELIRKEGDRRRERERERERRLKHSWSIGQLKSKRRAKKNGE
jgi:hypothetical protein